MKIQQFPNAIAQADLAYCQAEQELEAAFKELSRLDAEIEMAIAEDELLRNDQQRKARKLELQQSVSYQAQLHQIASLREHRDRCRIKLNLFINEFSIGKLYLRLRAARLAQRAA